MTKSQRLSKISKLLFIAVGWLIYAIITVIGTALDQFMWIGYEARLERKRRRNRKR
jgi:hypothetical protein